MPKKRKVHSLTGRITLELMSQAFLAVKRNRGAAGIDKVSVKMFGANLEENLAALMKDLKTGNFRPKPLRRKMIPKGPDTTKLRPLGIPVVRDRVAQEVVRRLLAPIFEPRFHDASFGFIPKRNCHQAIERVLQYHRQGGRETKPSYQRNGTILRRELFYEPLDVPETGLVDSHTASLYEAEAEKLQRQS